MERNIELLNRTMEYVEQHPENHVQSTWGMNMYDSRGNICGTAACFGGWGAVLTYGPNVIVPPHTWNGRTSPIKLPPPHDKDTAMDSLTSLFGLTTNEAITLFHADNTVEMLRLMVNDLVAGNPLHDNRFYARQTGHQAWEWWD